MFSRMAVLVVATCAIAGACTENPMAPEDSYPVHVEGTITSSVSGAPVEGARVELFYTEYIATGGWNDPVKTYEVVPAVARSDASGHYRLDGVAGIGYRMRVTAVGFQRTLPISIRSETIDIVLVPNGQ